MATHLTIRWDGTAPGLQEHALSLSAWLEPLGHLLTAVKRVASGIVTEALDDPDYGIRGGRLSKQVELLDLQIVRIGSGSAQLHLECVLPPPPGQQDMFWKELPRRSLERVVNSIDQESRGNISNSVVRKFLSTLPEGVTTQEYLVESDGQQVVSVKIESVHVFQPAAPLAGLRRLAGHVVGVGFEPGNSTISLKVDGKTLTFAASGEQVDKAIGLRGGAVVAMCATGTKPRLIWLSGVGDVPMAPDRAALTDWALKRWARTLEILSQ